MAVMPLGVQNEFCSDLGLVQKTMSTAIHPQYATKKMSYWDIWLQFCAKHKINPFFNGIEDPIPLLQVFAHRYRDSIISPSGQGVKSEAVSDALCSVGQKFSSLGANDPRKDSFGKIDFCLTRLYPSFKKTDKPKIRVKPLPVCVVMSILNHAFSPGQTERTQAIANLVCY